MKGFKLYSVRNAAEKTLAVRSFIAVCVGISLLSSCSSDSDPTSVNEDLHAPLTPPEPATFHEPEIGAAMEPTVPPVEVGRAGIRPRFINANMLISTNTYKFSEGIQDYPFYNKLPYSLRAAGDLNADGLQDFVSTTTGDPYSRAYQSISGAPATMKNTTIFGMSGGWPERTPPVGNNDDHFMDGAGQIALNDVIHLGDINGDGKSDMGIVSYPDTNLVSTEEDVNFDTIILLDAVTTLGTGIPPEVDGRVAIRIINSSSEFLDKSVRQLFPAGDVNGDEIDDFLVTYSINHTDPGPVPDMYLVFGSADHNNLTLDIGDPSTALPIDVNLLANDRIVNGVIAGIAADYNGDGLDDLTISIGEYCPAEGFCTFGQHEENWVLYGRSDFGSQTLILPEAAVQPGRGFQLSHTLLPDTLQSGIAAVKTPELSQPIGDINGDGYDDLVVGYTDDQIIIQAGGQEASRWMTLQWGSTENGGAHWPEDSTVIGVGDVDGDNIDDLAMKHLYAANERRVNHTHRIVLIYGDPIYTPTETAANYYIEDRLTVIDAWGSSPVALGDVDGDGIADMGLSTQPIPESDVHPGYTPVFAADGSYNILVSLDTRPEYNEVTREHVFQILPSPGMQPELLLPVIEPPVTLGPADGYFIDSSLLKEITGRIDELYVDRPTNENPYEWKFFGDAKANPVSISLQWSESTTVYQRFYGRHNYVSYNVGESLTLHYAGRTGFGDRENSIDCKIDLFTEKVLEDGPTCSEVITRTLEQLATWK